MPERNSSPRRLPGWPDGKPFIKLNDTADPVAVIHQCRRNSTRTASWF
jgi:hypothetical protein